MMVDLLLVLAHLKQIEMVMVTSLGVGRLGGTAVSNTSGNITSSVSVNQEAGFSIVSYTGNGSNGQTVGHGLGKKPAWILLKAKRRYSKLESMA